jgi:diguanylate cyclase (GGDEF)-like protein
MNFRNGDTLSTVKRDLRGAILGTSVSLAGSAALLLILNLIMPANPFLGGLIATSVISIVVVFPLLLSMRRKDGELRKMQARLNHAARHDTVTNTLNGSVLAAAVEHYIDRRKTIATDPGGILVAVIVQELDAISRRYGPQWGDSIMQSLAGIVQSSIRRGDLVARLASNELSIFLPGATAENAEEIGKRIQQKLTENTSRRPRHHCQSTSNLAARPSKNSATSTKSGSERAKWPSLSVGKITRNCRCSRGQDRRTGRQSLGRWVQEGGVSETAKASGRRKGNATVPKADESAIVMSFGRRQAYESPRGRNPRATSDGYGDFNLQLVSAMARPPAGSLGIDADGPLRAFARVDFGLALGRMRSFRRS